MHTQSTTRKILVAVVLFAILLTSCNLKTATLPATIAVPSTAPTTEDNTPAVTAPTGDVQATLDAVKTQAAQTVVAELTLNAPTATPITPTSTATATATITQTATITRTYTSTVKPTSTFIPWTATPKYTATPKGYACSITSTSPKPTDSIKINTDFDGNWVVKNVGTLTWSQHAVDIKYISGTKFQTKADLFDLKSDVAPDASYTVIVDMKSPATAGTYAATWAIVQMDLTICTLNLTVKVVN